MKEVPQHEVAAGDANTHEHPVVGPSIPTWSNTEAEVSSVLRTFQPPGSTSRANEAPDAESATYVAL